jgi:hypothetical protein
VQLYLKNDDKLMAFKIKLKVIKLISIDIKPHLLECLQHLFVVFFFGVQAKYIRAEFDNKI